MSDTQPAIPRPDTSTINFCVDEAGDPVLFDRDGRVIVGSEGCSKHFIVGKLQINHAEQLADDLQSLRTRLLSDSYFKSVPSMQPGKKKTAARFHAKDDPAEVRYEVYKVLRNHDLRFYAAVREKASLVAYVKQQNEREPAYRYRKDELYDTLVQELFKTRWHTAERFRICFAKRGSKDRTEAFRVALKNTVTDVESESGLKTVAHIEVECSTPQERAGLQAVDYFLWALQRYYERGEDRFIQMLWQQVGEVHDLDRVENQRRGVRFNKSRPLPLLQAS